jgi:undecaprenyl-diphosphatase
MSFELSILDFIQTHLQCGFLDTVIPFITKLGDGGILWIIGTVVMLLIPKTRRLGAAMAVSLALEIVCCNIILKPLVARIRPCDVNTAFSLLIAHPTDYSFPSGHTGASFSAAAALYFGKSCLWIPAGVIAVLIAFSRLYLYVHYPSDVLAGALFGIMLGWLGNFTVRRLEGKSHANNGNAA